MSAEDRYAEFYVTPDEWRKLKGEEENERRAFSNLPPREAQEILRAALPMDGVEAPLGAGPESF
jgi:hypothetical protein